MRASKNLSANTLRAYAIDLEEFRRFVGADRPVGEIDRSWLRAYLRHLFDARKLKEYTSVSDQSLKASIISAREKMPLARR